MVPGLKVPSWDPQESDQKERPPWDAVLKSIHFKTPNKQFGDLDLLVQFRCSKCNLFFFFRLQNDKFPRLSLMFRVTSRGKNEQKWLREHIMPCNTVSQLELVHGVR